MSDTLRAERLEELGDALSEFLFLYRLDLDVINGRGKHYRRRNAS